MLTNEIMSVPSSTSFPDRIRSPKSSTIEVLDPRTWDGDRLEADAVRQLHSEDRREPSSAQHGTGPLTRELPVPQCMDAVHEHVAHTLGELVWLEGRASLAEQLCIKEDDVGTCAGAQHAPVAQAKAGRGRTRQAMH